MKKLLAVLVSVVLLTACQKSENDAVVSDFTGNQTTYSLVQASSYAISGNVVFKERKDGTTTIVIALKGITDNNEHPVHLHLGDISVDQANIAALLSPVAGSNGISSTTLSILADESKVTYQDLIKLSACVKVHLASVGSEADIILAAGNVGGAVTANVPGGRLGVAACKTTN